MNPKHNVSDDFRIYSTLVTRKSISSYYWQSGDKMMKYYADVWEICINANVSPNSQCRNDVCYGGIARSYRSQLYLISREKNLER